MVDLGQYTPLLNQSQMYYKIYPLVLSNILNCYVRSEYEIKHSATPQKITAVLMGTVEGDIIQAKNAFCIRLEKVKDSEYRQLQEDINLLKFYTKANKQETVVGMAYIGKEINQEISQFAEHYKKISKKNSLTQLPIMQVSIDTKSAKIDINLMLKQESALLKGLCNVYINIPSQVVWNCPEETGMDEITYLKSYTQTTTVTLDKVVKSQDVKPNKEKELVKSITHDTNKNIKSIVEYLNKVKKEEIPMNYGVMEELQKTASKMKGLQQFESRELLESRNMDILLIEGLMKITNQQKEIFQTIASKVPH